MLVGLYTSSDINTSYSAYLVLALTLCAQQGYGRFEKQIKGRGGCRRCRRCWGAVSRIADAILQFDAVELKQHERELMQVGVFVYA